jgi:hypothetical protein
MGFNLAQNEAERRAMLWHSVITPPCFPEVLLKFVFKPGIRECNETAQSFTKPTEYFEHLKGRGGYAARYI